MGNHPMKTDPMLFSRFESLSHTLNQLRSMVVYQVEHPDTAADLCDVIDYCTVMLGRCIKSMTEEAQS